MPSRSSADRRYYGHSKDASTVTNNNVFYYPLSETIQLLSEKVLIILHFQTLNLFLLLVSLFILGLVITWGFSLALVRREKFSLNFL